MRRYLIWNDLLWRNSQSWSDAMLDYYTLYIYTGCSKDQIFFSKTLRIKLESKFDYNFLKYFISAIYRIEIDMM